MKNETRTHLDLFSGIGGFALAARNCGIQTVAFCEIESYAQRVLAKNFEAIMADAESGGKRGLPTERGPQNIDPDRRGKKRAVSNPGHKQSPGRPETQEGIQTGEQTRHESASLCGAGFHPSIHRDIRKLDGRKYRGVWLLTGGFPCQPFSQAGRRRGAEDDRHLWPEMLRVISEARPAWIIGENVAGFLTMEQFDRILEVDTEGNAVGELGETCDRLGRFIANEAVADLEALDYDVFTFLIPAVSVDAKHRRDRVVIVAHAKRGCYRRNGHGQTSSKSRNGSEEAIRLQNSETPERYGETISHSQSISTRPGFRQIRKEQDRAQFRNTSAIASDSYLSGREEQRRPLPGREEHKAPECGCRWLPEPAVGRVANGVPNRVDRLKGLGNAIVPQQFEQIMRAIIAVEEKEKR